MNAALIGSAIFLSLATVLTGLVLFHLARQNGRLLLRVETLEKFFEAGAGAASVEGQGAESGLPVGAPAPGFRLPGLHGETLTLDALRVVGNPVLLIFTQSECDPCDELLPEIAAWQRDLSARLMVSLIGSGSIESIRMKTSEHGIYNVVVQHDNETADAYGVPRSPSAVIVASDGTIGSGVAVGAGAIRNLVGTATGASTAAERASTASAQSQASMDNRAAAASRSSSSLAIGSPAPSIRLRDLRGKNVSLASKRGVKTMVLFWDPSCGFCNQILEDLRTWERDASEEAPKLLIISTGTVAKNAAMGLRSQILLDERFSAGTAFGADGTPTAVMVDEDGKIASEMAIGGQAVLSLARGELDSHPTAAVQTPKLGDPAPTVRLPDLSGKMTDLAEFRAKDTLLLFWNPACGFCQRMLQDLRAWESAQDDASPHLLVVSTGTVEANLEQALTAPVVLDQSFAVARSFGADGTPMAVLVDKDGRIASDLVGGAGAVLELASSQRPTR